MSAFGSIGAVNEVEIADRVVLQLERRVAS